MPTRPAVPHPHCPSLWPDLLMPRHDETWVSSSLRKLEKSTWSRLSHSAGAGEDQVMALHHEIWFRRAASAAEWWHLMMCKISNGALVLTVLGRTLGPFRLLQASLWCWPCVCADLHHQCDLMPWTSSSALLLWVTSQSDLKFRPFSFSL